MLDVYRSYYGLSGEPFRLGPDYRFSLHHTSYANAKAYLDYAIYQGEGFIAITGAPGTGKTTLISEILATLDRSRVQVATLTSTQLESRDLLHMVASSFGMQPDRFDKADLLLEIESFLVNKLHSGQRAMLIVDEAQGLSNAALEELRLLANLQYKYQLLLQICLVGQEKLLDIIHAPGMEHLQQRLVAATSLEPLGFDETIDYVEHRLAKVGWKGDPAIDEAALRLVFRYSHGIPRRINLIVNRLFLYGGMEHKHRIRGADAENVIAGLMEEHLLGSVPPLDESTIGELPAGRTAGSRGLPRPVPKTRPSGEQPRSGRGTAAGTDAGTEPPPDNLNRDRENLPGSRPRPRTGDAGSGPTRQAAPASDDTTRVRTRQPSFAARSPEPPPMEPVRPRPPAAQAQEKKSINKGVLLVGLLIASAVVAYYLRIETEDVDGTVAPMVGRNTVEEPLEALTSGPDELAATAGQTGDGVSGGDEPVATLTPGPAADGEQQQGSIIREPKHEAPESDTNLETAATATAETVTADADTATMTGEESGDTAADPVARSEDAALATTASTDVAATRIAPQPVEAAPEPVARAEQVQVPAPEEKPEQPQDTTASEPETEPSPQAAVRAASQQLSTSSAAIAAQREQLQEAAERRFSSQLAQLQTAPESAPSPNASRTTGPAVAPATTPPPPAVAPATPAPPPATAVVASRPKVSTPPAAKKKPRITASDVKAALLDGRWVSSNKPASLLPSESTFCKTASTGINCVSVPQNVKTQYGLALYKVESELSSFSAEGLFEMSYRTLVKLVSDKSGRSVSSGNSSEDEWQVTEYSMSCKLTGSDRVSCLDGKGITREYRRLPR